MALAALASAPGIRVWLPDRAYDDGRRPSELEVVMDGPGVLGALLEGAALSERFVSQSSREDLLKQGKAIKGPDGKPIFPISSAKDAENAATLWVSGHHKTPAARAHIVKWARKLGAKAALAKLGVSS